ncbi:MAG TPA: hypothetical protein VG097_01425 [Gemmata sp.]|nr:hypothetical protein [Gemmata sp.]
MTGYLHTYQARKPGVMMTLRRMMLGLMLVMAATIWSWCRPADKQAQAQVTADPVYEAEPDAPTSGGTQEDASYRFRSNQSTHWRQVTIGCRASCP